MADRSAQRPLDEMTSQASRRAASAVMGTLGRYLGGASHVLARAASPSVGAYAPWAAPRARRFFEVPNLSDLCEKTFSSSKTVQHSPEDLFAVVADVDRYQEFVPFCAGSRVLRRTSHTRFEAELEIGFRLFNERYVSDVSLVPGESVTAEAVRTPGGLFERLVSTWRFERGAHPRECVVKFDIDFRVGSVLHAQAVGLFFEEVSRMQINAFEARCVELYRGRAAGAVSGSSRVGGVQALGGSGSGAQTTKQSTETPRWETELRAAFHSAEIAGRGRENLEKDGWTDGGDADAREPGEPGLGLRDFAIACASPSGSTVASFASHWPASGAPRPRAASRPTRRSFAPMQWFSAPYALQLRYCPTVEVEVKFHREIHAYAWISRWNLTSTSTVGQYLNCNAYGAENHCMGANDRLVGREAALGLGAPLAGQCDANEATVLPLGEAHAMAKSRRPRPGSPGSRASASPPSVHPSFSRFSRPLPAISAE